MNTQESLRKTSVAASAALVAAAAVLGAAQSRALAADENHRLQEKIAFTNTDAVQPFAHAEIYLMDPDGSNLLRLTENSDGEAFAALSPDGERIVFDSNRLRAEDDPLNTSDLFVMDDLFAAVDGALGGEEWLVRGSSATWSPDGQYIAYHASQSGSEKPIDPNPGAATTDSDIFVLNVDDVLAGLAEPINLTNDGAGPEGQNGIDSDADWSPPVDSVEEIVFTSHPSSEIGNGSPNNNRPHAEIYVMNADGSPQADGSLRRRLTHNLEDNLEEERAPAWSPDGSHIAYMCRVADGRFIPPRFPDFEICVMPALGDNVPSDPRKVLTNDTFFDASPKWSPDGTQIVFGKIIPGQGQQLWIMNADDGANAHPVTPPPEGTNSGPTWGVVRTHN